ncbi:MAG: (d)CMP kinase [Marinilabiliales bacterium]
MKKIIIAIDGYSGCGKSTLARDLAKKLNYIYIDTGAMYRAVTLYCMQHNLCNDLSKLIDIINEDKIRLEFKTTGNKQHLFMNGQNIEGQIRTIEVAKNVSSVSQIPEVRKKLVSIQREIGKNKGVVMDGRDIGTVVFPDAELKIFMTADVYIRAKRRFEELNNPDISFDEIVENIKQRDYLDENRDISPLKKADDAIILDNSNMTREQQLKFVMKIIEEKFEK